MVINREGNPMGRSPFGLFLVSLDLTYGQNISSKVLNHFERFPRKSHKETALGTKKGSELQFRSQVGYVQNGKILMRNGFLVR